MEVVTNIPDKCPENAGSGDGYGSGDGSGSGYGSGDGYGYGYGSGSGSGSGDGDGYGYGSGSGSGDGDGYWARTLDAFARQDALVCYWRSGPNGQPVNGGSGTKAKPGLVEEIAGPLAVCTAKALHGTFDPNKWKGERLWVVAMHGELQFDDDKVGALKREILFEVINPLR